MLDQYYDILSVVNVKLLLTTIIPFAVHSPERLSSAVVHSPILKKCKLSFKDRVLRSSTSSDSPAFSFLGVHYHMKPCSHGYTQLSVVDQGLLVLH